MTTTSTLWPSLGYHDAPAALRFLVAAFGFEEVAVYHGERDGWIDQAVLRWPGGGMVTLHSTEPGAPAIADLPGPGSPAIGIYLFTVDPDALYERALAAGATPVGAPRDNDRGTRDATVGDLEGGSWSFGTYSGD